MQLIGPDVICDNGTFSIKNFPTKATVDWIVGNDLYSQLNQASPAITLNNLGTPGGSSIYTTLTAIVHTKEYTVQFSKPITSMYQEYKKMTMTLYMAICHKAEVNAD